MTDYEFTALSDQDKVEVLSTSVFIAISEEIFAILFLVDNFFVEAFYDIDQHLLMTTTYSSSGILPDRYFNLIILDDLLK